MRLKTRYFIFILLLILPALSRADFYGVAHRVIDGDTVDVLQSNGQVVRVRLAFIDAPESNQAWGAVATTALKILIEGQTIRVLEHSSTQERIPRILGVIYLGNENINLLMVRNGLAWAYRYKGRALQPEYEMIESEAKSAHLGLWIDTSPLEPWHFRARQRQRQQQHR